MTLVPALDWHMTLILDQSLKRPCSLSLSLHPKQGGTWNDIRVLPMEIQGTNQTNPRVLNFLSTPTISNSWSLVCLLLPVYRKCLRGTGRLYVLTTYIVFCLVRLTRWTLHKNRASNSPHSEGWNSTHPTQSANSMAFGTVAESRITLICAGSMISTSSQTTPR